MKPLIASSMIGLLVIANGRADDWRHEWLQSRGIGTSRQELAKIAGDEPDASKIPDYYRQLGDDQHAVREQAQQQLIAMGAPAETWLRQQPPSDDPEVAERTATIMRAISSRFYDLDDFATRHAARSLLKQTGGKPDPTTGGVFYEWFGLDPGPVTDHYRLLSVDLSPPIQPRVIDGRLILPGDDPPKNSRRLVLKSSQWPGAREFPDSFTVSAKLGSPTYSGTWHLGLSIGRVRALYHPGMPGGEFRIQRVDTAERLIVPNLNMGFTPSIKSLQRMEIAVQRLKNRSVRLTISILEQNGEPFTTTFDAPADVIGPLDQVSLDRCGFADHDGGACFEDLMIRLGKD